MVTISVPRWSREEDKVSKSNEVVADSLTDGKYKIRSENIESDKSYRKNNKMLLSFSEIPGFLRNPRSLR